MVRGKQPVPKRRGFVYGALLLTAGVLLVKVFGALFKIPLSTIITEEGMGYFGTAYSFYNVIFSIATAGLPVAVARMVSAADSLGEWRAIRQIHRVSLPLFGAMGIVGMLMMIGLAPVYTQAVQNPGALLAMLTLAPSVLLCSVAAAYRGYYEGLCDMTPTAVSQVIEAAAKLLFGLWFAWIAVRIEDLTPFARVLSILHLEVLSEDGMRYALGAAGAILGVTLGSALSASFLFLRHRLSGGIEPNADDASHTLHSKRAIVKTLASSALPLSIGAVALSVSGLIDSSFMQTRLLQIVHTAPQPMLAMYAGSIPESVLSHPETIPNYLFGCYNMALTLFMLVPSITQAFGMSALPSVTRAYTGGGQTELKQSVETVLRMTCAFAIPAGLGLSVLAEPIAHLLYGDRISVPIVAQALTVMGCAAIFAAVTTPLGSILQAIGHTELPVILTLCGLVIKVVLNFILVGIPHINILGGGISTLVGYAAVTAAEWIALQRLTGVKLNIIHVVVKPAAAALLCCLTARNTQQLQIFLGLNNRFSALVSAIFAALVYIITMLLLGAVKKTEIIRIISKENCKNTGKNT